MGMQKLMSLAVLLLAGLLAACGPSAPEPAASPAPQVQAEPAPTTTTETEAGGPVLVFLGDSLTAGFGLGPEYALPEQIGARLERAGVEARIINAGVSGDTTAGGLARYDWSVASANPDLVFVALGANDYLGGGSPDQARANLRAILTRLQADGVQAVIASVEARASGIDDPRAEAFSQIYPELAAEFGVPHFIGLLSKVRGRADLLLQDGLHPTAEGVGLMADDVAAFLVPIVSGLAD